VPIELNDELVFIKRESRARTLWALEPKK
jgi:hypothetical protein